MKEKCGLFGLYLNSPSHSCINNVIKGCETTYEIVQELSYSSESDLNWLSDIISAKRSRSANVPVTPYSI